MSHDFKGSEREKAVTERNEKAGTDRNENAGTERNPNAATERNEKAGTERNENTGIERNRNADQDRPECDNVAGIKQSARHFAMNRRNTVGVCRRCAVQKQDRESAGSTS